MSFLPRLTVQDHGASLKVLLSNNTELTRGKRFTFLSEDVVTGGATIKVQNILGFESLSTSSGQIVCIGKIGDEKTELRRTSTTTGESPSEAYQWVYLRDTLRFDHPQDTPVAVVNWDRVEFQYAASTTGTKTTITTYPTPITPDATATTQRDTTDPSNRLTGAPTTAFYFARFNNTIDSRNSDWSDAVYGTGYDDNTVYAIKERALNELGETIDGEIITDEFLNQCLWKARREYHQSPGKRPFRRRFGFDIGNALTGSFRIDLPADVEKPYGAENVYGVRIGANANMEWYDKKEFDYDYQGKPHTRLTTAYTVDTDQDLYLEDVRDFSDSGSVSVEGTSIGYSARGISGGTLRISTHGDWSVSAGSDAWQNISYGLPSKFTVFASPGGSAHVYFNRPIDTAYIDQNIYLDYYSTLLGYNSNGDVLDEPQYDMYVHYLKACIKHRKSKGEANIAQDPDYLLWLKGLNNAIATEYLSTEIRFAPDIEHLDIPD